MKGDFLGDDGPKVVKNEKDEGKIINRQNLPRLALSLFSA